MIFSVVVGWAGFFWGGEIDRGMVYKVMMRHGVTYRYSG